MSSKTLQVSLQDAWFEKNVRFTSWYGKEKLPEFFTMLPGINGKVGMIWAEARSKVDGPQTIYTATFEKGILSTPHKLQGQGRGLVLSLSTFPTDSKTWVVFSQEPVPRKNPPQEPSGTGYKTSYVEKLYSVFWDGNQFSQAVLIPNQGSGEVQDLVLTEGKYGMLAALWSQQVKARADAQDAMFGATWNGKKWTTQRLSHAWYQPHRRFEKPVIVKKKNGTLVALWSHDAGSKKRVASIQLYSSHWNGFSWSKPKPLLPKAIPWHNDQKSAESKIPSMAAMMETSLKTFVTPEGKILAIWRQLDLKSQGSFERYAQDRNGQDPQKIYFSVLDQSTWSIPKELNYPKDNVFGSDPQLVQLVDGTILAIWPECLALHQKKVSSLCTLFWNGQSFIPSGKVEGQMIKPASSRQTVEYLQFLPQKNGSLLAVWFSEGYLYSHGDIWGDTDNKKDVLSAVWKNHMWSQPQIVLRAAQEKPISLELSQYPPTTSYAVFETIHLEKDHKKQMQTSLYLQSFEEGVTTMRKLLNNPKTEVVQPSYWDYSFMNQDSLLILWKQKSSQEKKVVFWSAILQKGKLRVAPIWENLDLVSSPVQDLDLGEPRSMQLEQPLFSKDGSHIVLLGQNRDTLDGKQWDGSKWISILTWKNPKSSAEDCDEWAFTSPISLEKGPIVVGVENHVLAGILTFLPKPQ